MSSILGFDASTQSLSVIIIDIEEGCIVLEDTVSFGIDLPEYGHTNGFLPSQPGCPDGEIHTNPLMWLDALDLLLSRIPPDKLSRVSALSGSGQQHGSVYLNNLFKDTLKRLHTGENLATQLNTCLSRKTSPIWMDHSTSEECREITASLGNATLASKKSGSVVTERFTAAQIRKFFKNQPDAWAQTEVIHLVSSFFCSVLAGKSAPIDMGDGAGMNLLNLARKNWDEELLAATAEGLLAKLPPITTSHTVVGKIAPYFIEKYGFNPNCSVINWSGDNPCSLIGVGASSHGKAVISLGTSDTLFTSMPEPRIDPNSYGHVFGNPLADYMSLICFRNGSLARESVKDKYHLTWDDFNTEALSATEPGLGGRLALPFIENEITPLVKSKDFIFNDKWSEQDKIDAKLVVRATLEGQFLNMKAQSLWMNVILDEIIVTGGASQNDGICQVISNVFGCKVSRIKTSNSAGLGAALIAATSSNMISLQMLEGKFCKKKETISPNDEAVTIYNELLPSFQSFIKTHLK